jgi:hypothetical protein
VAVLYQYSHLCIYNSWNCVGSGCVHPRFEYVSVTRVMLSIVVSGCKVSQFSSYSTGQKKLRCSAVYCPPIIGYVRMRDNVRA